MVALSNIHSTVGLRLPTPDIAMAYECFEKAMSKIEHSRSFCQLVVFKMIVPATSYHKLLNDPAFFFILYES